MIALRLLRRPDGLDPGNGLHAVPRSGATIGRSADCHVVLDDPLRLVSRQHATLVPTGGEMALLRCISASAALAVNGQSLAPGGERLVRVGDLLRIGGFELLIESEPGSAPTMVLPVLDVAAEARMPRGTPPAAPFQAPPPVAPPRAAPRPPPPELPPAAPSRAAPSPGVPSPGVPSPGAPSPGAPSPGAPSPFMPVAPPPPAPVAVPSFEPVARRPAPAVPAPAVPAPAVPVPPRDEAPARPRVEASPPPSREAASQAPSLGPVPTDAVPGSVEVPSFGAVPRRPAAAPPPPQAAPPPPVAEAPSAPLAPSASPAAPEPVAPAAPARRPRLDQWFDLDTAADPLGPGSPLPATDGTHPGGTRPQGGAALPRVAAVVPMPPIPQSAAAPPAPLPVPPVAPTPARAAAPSAAFEAIDSDAAPPPAAPSAQRAAAVPTPAAPSALATPPAPARSAAPSDARSLAPGDADALRRAFLRGAGLEFDASNAAAVAVDVPWMEHLGALLRAAAEGTLALLRSRAVTKRSIRAEGTRIAARENNPLKFAPDTVQALALLINRHGARGFLDPVDALRDAHHDLQVHQLAMMAGMRAAVYELISRLGPEATEAAEGPPRGLGRYWGALREAALWRRHRQGHLKLLDNLDDDFEAIFGREFLRAYEAQSQLAAGSDDEPQPPPAA